MKYLLIFLLFFTACQDKTYSHIYKQSEIGANISTISLSETNQTIKAIITSALKNTHFIVAIGSPYALEIDGATYPKKCNNPNTSTYDATYDGYVKLTLLKNMKLIYMCQKDYHGTLDESAFATLLEKMQEDLKLTP